MRIPRRLLSWSVLSVVLVCAGASGQQPFEGAKSQNTPATAQPAYAPRTVYEPVLSGAQFGSFTGFPFGGNSETAHLAQQYVKSDKEDEKREIRKKLSDMLTSEFDKHAQHQQKELADLEKEINRLRALLSKRLEAKSKIVERRLETVIQDAEGLGWNSPNTPRASGFGRGGSGGGWGFVQPPVVTTPPAAAKAP